MSRNPPRFLLVALVEILISTAIHGQVCALGKGSSFYKPNLDQPAAAKTIDLTRRIGEAFTPVCAPKCPTVGVFHNPTAANALTFVASGSMKTVYSPAFLTTVNERYGEDALIGIVAHEYGHVIDAVSIGSWMNTNWTPELRADAWAGCGLAKLKLTPASLERALTAVSRFPSVSQPVWNPRVLPLRMGYSRCGGEASDFDKGTSRIRLPVTKR